MRCTVCSFFGRSDRLLLTIAGFTVLIAAFVFGSFPAHALSRCKARVHPSDGTILVQANEVVGTLKWGIQPDDVNYSLMGCEKLQQTPRRCLLGAADTLAAKTPPAGCVLYLADDSDTCSMWIRFCSMGLRIVDGSFPPGDPRVLGAVSLEDGGKTIRFTGVNVQVVDGTGDTGGPPTGLGNLIVGYNQEESGPYDRTGSHNLIVGDENGYSGYGGFVAGRENTISSAYTSVSGGLRNMATGPGSSVSGGMWNQATGLSSSVSGGGGNIASYDQSSVSGGYLNEASGPWSSVNGGIENAACGEFSSVSGGRSHCCIGDEDWAAGSLWEDQ